jgi:hypothetical protein
MKSSENIKEFNITYKDFPNFIGRYKKIMILEILNYLETDISNIEYRPDNIFRINLKLKETDELPYVILDCIIDELTIQSELEEMLSWSIEMEEYEISHRIQLMQSKLNKVK